MTLEKFLRDFLVGYANILTLNVYNKKYENDPLIIELPDVYINNKILFCAEDFIKIHGYYVPKRYLNYYVNFFSVQIHIDNKLQGIVVIISDEISDKLSEVDDVKN